MGIFRVNCSKCKEPFNWVAGNVHNLCPECQKKIDKTIDLQETVAVLREKLDMRDQQVLEYHDKLELAKETIKTIANICTCKEVKIILNKYYGEIE